MERSLASFRDAPSSALWSEPRIQIQGLSRPASTVTGSFTSLGRSRLVDLGSLNDAAFVVKA